VSHKPDRLILTSCKHIDIGCPDALGHLQQRFAAWWGAVELITLPGGQALAAIIENGTPIELSLVKVPRRSGSPHGVFGGVYAFCAATDAVSNATPIATPHRVPIGWFTS
jgi:hypothetical protein